MRRPSLSRKRSMRYAVELKSGTAQKIVGWNLSSHLQREILNGLDALAINPSRLLIRVRAPYDVLQYDLTVREPTAPPRDHLFTFTVRYATDEERLLVVD
jgi:hypothetical protein